MGQATGGTTRLMAEVSCSHGFASVRGWRWIKRGESPAVASFWADGHRYVARIFGGEAESPRAEYISGLALHLASAGVNVEEVVRSVSGEPFVRLQGGVPMVVSRFSPDSPMSIPFGADDAQTWGRYVARMHAACLGWSSPVALPSPWLRHEPRAVLDRALALAAHLHEPRSILERASERIIGCREGADAAQPVHGDLWPGNLLGGPHGFRAIDFAEAGDGPRTIDLATAFRWMPWRDDPSGAAGLWSAWLSGYCEAGTISQAELDAVPPVACLQSLTWMIAEVSASTVAAETSWYVEDHCSEVQALLLATAT